MSKFERDAFAAAVLENSYEVEILAPLDREAAFRYVQRELDDLWNLNEPATLNKRSRHFQIPETSDEDYRERVFELSSLKPFLAGIRHAGGNRDLPFVCVTPGFQITPSDIQPLKKVLMSAFRVFAPLHFAVWMKPTAEKEFSAFGTTLGRRYLASRMESLNASPRGLSDFHLKPLSDDGYFKWYQEQYSKFHRQNPILRSWVPMADKGDLESHRRKGFLFGAYFKEELVGLIGGEPLELLGMRGLYVSEILISDQHQGKKWASVLQQKFFANFQNDFDLVWGTIDARNEPSTRAALRAGRKAIRSELFFPLE